jgi:hypothetical protein
VLLILQGCQERHSEISISTKDGGVFAVKLQKCNFPYQGENYMAFHTEVSDKSSDFPCATGTPTDDFVELRTGMVLNESLRLRHYKLVSIEDAYTVYSNGDYEILSFNDEGAIVQVQYAIENPRSFSINKMYSNGVWISVAFDSASRSRQEILNESRSILSFKFNGLMARVR